MSLMGPVSFQTPAPESVSKVHKEGKKIRNPLPEKYHERLLFDRLYHVRSDIPAITHVDFSARIQTVNKKLQNKINTLKERWEMKWK